MEIEAMENAGIIELLNETFFVDLVKVFKPHTDVYEMVPNMYDVDACHVYFTLSKLWAPGAEANFGFRSVGINRFSQRPKNISRIQSDMQPTLEVLPELLGSRSN